MPKLSDTMEVGVLAGWNVSVGDEVDAGDILAEIETDKATMEYEAPFDGKVLHLAASAGDEVEIGDLIAIIGEEGEDVDAIIEEFKASQPASKGNGQEEEAKPEPAKEQEKEEAKAEPAEQKAASAAGSEASAKGAAKLADAAKGEGKAARTPDGRIKASPLARSMAVEHGIPLAQIEGSGEGGRIVKRDIEQYLEQGGVAAAEGVGSAAADGQGAALGGVIFDPAPGEQYQDVKVSQMRKTIARRLGQSKFSAPHFYLTMAINMDEAVKFRSKLKEEDIKISYNDLIIKACASALRKHPMVNASWQGDHIRQYDFINVGVAVAVEEGLVVPVLRDTDRMGLQDISAQVREMAGRAREKKLTPEEMTGNTFTISNLGMYGIEEFTAIINPPDSVILAVGGIFEQPVVRNGAIVPGHVMRVTLSCDHRVVDGATGSEFLQTVKFMLENPMRILL